MYLVKNHLDTGGFFYFNHFIGKAGSEITLD